MKSVQELFEMEAQVKAGTVTQEDFLEACEDNEGVRICDDCGKLMVDGFVWGDGETVECKECKERTTTEAEYEKAYHNGEVYWTQWEE